MSIQIVLYADSATASVGNYCEFQAQGRDRRAALMAILKRLQEEGYRGRQFHLADDADGDWLSQLGLDANGFV